MNTGCHLKLLKAPDKDNRGVPDKLTVRSLAWSTLIKSVSFSSHQNGTVNLTNFRPFFDDRTSCPEKRKIREEDWTQSRPDWLKRVRPTFHSTQRFGEAWRQGIVSRHCFPGINASGKPERALRRWSLDVRLDDAHKTRKWAWDLWWGISLRLGGEFDRKFQKHNFNLSSLQRQEWWWLMCAHLSSPRKAVAAGKLLACSARDTLDPIGSPLSSSIQPLFKPSFPTNFWHMYLFKLEWLTALRLNKFRGPPLSTTLTCFPLALQLCEAYLEGRRSVIF
jgi:hypothetical protein